MFVRLWFGLEHGITGWFHGANSRQAYVFEATSCFSGDGDDLSPEQAAERKAACQQVSDSLQASVRAWNKRGKEQYEVDRLRPLLQLVSLAWTRRLVKNLGQAKVVQCLVGTFLTDAKAKSPPHSRQRVQSSTRQRTEGPHATTWENGSLEEAGVDFTAAQLTKHALLDPLMSEDRCVLLRRDTFEKDVIGQIQSSRPLAALLPAAEGELEQMRTEAQAKGLDTLIEVQKHAEMVHFVFFVKHEMDYEAECQNEACSCGNPCGC